MEEEIKRPGGLTALAVINFILAGFSVLGIAGLIFSVNMIGNMPTEGMTEAQKEKIIAFQNIDPYLFAIMIVMGAFSFLFLILSGIGYLKQKKILGRYMGTAYGFWGFLSVIVSILLFPKELGGGFGISTMIGIIYPAFTLILLNVVFANDLMD